MEIWLEVQMLSPNSIQEQKKSLYRNLKEFCPQIQLKTPKREGLNHNLVLYLAGICDLLVLTATAFSNRPDASS